MSGGAWACYIIGAVGIIGFIITERFLGDDALIPLKLFKSPTFSVATILGIMVGFGMFGALDQDWTEDANWPPNGSGIEERFRSAKALGLNTLRCHVKIPDPLYFALADRLGLIVWLDMPYMQFLTPATREALRRVFFTSVAAHGHHPSIAIWTLFNEGWGIDLDDNPDDRRWLIETFDWAKTLVPESLLVDNSPSDSKALNVAHLRIRAATASCELARTTLEYHQAEHGC